MVCAQPSFAHWGKYLPGRKLGRRWIFLRDEIEATVRGQPGDRSAA